MDKHADNIARFLIEGAAAAEADLDKKVKVLIDRMTLQITSVTPLLAHWVDTSNTPAENGKVKIQFGFLKLPEEVLPQLKRLLSVDYFDNYRLVKYIKNGQAMTGLEIVVHPDDLPGEAYDYAY